MIVNEITHTDCPWKRSDQEIGCSCLIQRAIERLHGVLKTVNSPLADTRIREALYWLENCESVQQQMRAEGKI